MYTGYDFFKAESDEDLADFYSGKIKPEGLHENQFLLIKDKEDKIVDKYCFQNGELRRVYTGEIKTKIPTIDLIRPRNIYQELAIDMLHDNRSKIKVLTGRYGTGKAQPVDTILPTPNGFKKAGEIKVGDYLFSRFGEPTQVTGVFPQGWKICYRITFEDGRTAITADSHLWSIYKEDEFEVVSTRELAMRRNVKIPLAQPVLYKENEELKIDPYSLGVYLGSGGEKSRNSCTELLKKIKKSIIFQEIKNQYEELKGSVYEWSIPDSYLRSSTENRLKLLQGISDAAGYGSLLIGRLKIKHKSANFLNSLKELIWSLGGKAFTHYYKMPELRPDEYATFYLTYELPSEKNLQPSLCIKSVEKLPAAKDMVCFSVDNFENLYLTTDYIVTHNTMLMFAAALEAVEQNKAGCIVYVRNGLSPQGVPDIGYLPGAVSDKTLIWALPLADLVGGTYKLEELIKQGILQVEPLNFIRGRSFKKSIIFSDESANLTKELIQLLIGRVGDKSELWIAGDYRQTDLGRNFSPGLQLMIERLVGQPLFSTLNLEKIERSEVAALSDLLD